MAWDDPHHRAELLRARYWSDPDLRLRTINRARAYQGLAPRASVDDIAPRRGAA